MARSTKSSKSSTKQTEETDQTAAEEEKQGADEAPDDSPASESANDIGEESTTDTATDATEGAEAPAVGAEVENVGQDAVVSETDPKETASDETPTVPGVIPAYVETAPAPPPVSAAAPTGPGTFALVSGGLVAGAIGFLVATYAVPEGWPNPEPAGVDSLEASLSEQAERLDALITDFADLRDAASAGQEGIEIPDLAPISSEIAGLETRVSDTVASLDGKLAEIGNQMESLEARLSELEARPAQPAAADGSAAMEAQLESFRRQLDEVTADAESRIAEAQSRASEIETEAAAAAAAAEREAALTSLKAALDSGATFESTLSVFEDAPEALTSFAADGIPTLSGLQASFPNAARAALSQAQTVPQSASAGDRFVAFLKRRTNARSLTPQDGSDPDAVLSRAEAALADGDLESVLSELESLPETARDAMSDWISAAETRAAALSAAASLENTPN